MHEKTGWIAPVDGLRAIAILFVLAHHGNPLFFANVALAEVGVVIFFAISGFLAYYVLHRDETRLGQINYNYFLLRRILRIWPAYFTIIGFVWLTYKHQDGWFMLFTFTSNWNIASFRSWPPGPLGPLWTIAVEEQFYVLAPIMYLMIRSRWCVLFCAAIFFGANALRVFYMATSTGQGNGGLYYITYTYADTFLTGALIADWYLRRRTVSAIIQHVAFWTSTFILGFILWAWSFTVFPPYGALAPFTYAALPFGAGLLLFSALPFNQLPLDRFLSSSLMVWLGKLSYSIYLVHAVVLHNLYAPNDSRFSFNVFYVAVVLSTAFFLHSFIEKPVLQFKDRIAPGAKRIPWPAILTLGAISVGLVGYFRWQLLRSGFISF
jgi:peptidoglycan/LPS O-acetylase OafA/YrhL